MRVSGFFLLISMVRSYLRPHRTQKYQFLLMKSGGHGVEFRYLPIHQAKETENFPRILQIAGVYPQITADQIRAPAKSVTPIKGVQIITTCVSLILVRCLELWFLRSFWPSTRNGRSPSFRCTRDQHRSDCSHFNEPWFRYQNSWRYRSFTGNWSWEPGVQTRPIFRVQDIDKSNHHSMEWCISARSRDSRESSPVHSTLDS